MPELPDAAAVPLPAAPAPSSSSSDERRPARTGASAFVVGVGILLARLVGLVRQRVFAHYFGSTWVADAFSAALRLPNITQNLLGEGTLSASFIPVYARALGRGDAPRAREFARAVLGILLALVLLLSAVGFGLAPWLTKALVPGFQGEKLALAIRLVRIFFPMTGLLALSAWSLGILNSHRHFFLPYAAPVVWSLSQIVSLVWGGQHAAGAQLALLLGYGALLGAALQLVIQLPLARRLLGSVLHPTTRWKSADVREAVRAFGPVVLGRGVVQLSALFDTFLASLLGTGANATLGYVQALYILPVSLFGVGEAAAVLPELARETAGQDDAARAVAMRRRVGESLTRVGFTSVPTTVGFALLADQLVGAVYQTGRFGQRATALVAPALAAYILGLLANASVRVMASAYYALGDTKTPARFAVYRVTVSAGASYLLMQRFGVVGLCGGAASAGWVEALALGSRLRTRLGGLDLPAGRWGSFALSSFAAGLLGVGVRHVCHGLPILLSAAASLSAFGATYLVSAYLLGVPDLHDFIAAVRRRLGRRPG
ncbi:MAG: murein biosynthesis integral membrane protein MurJ [Deltaproteobacteria bacterium]